MKMTFKRGNYYPHHICVNVKIQLVPVRDWYCFHDIYMVMQYTVISTHALLRERAMPLLHINIQSFHI